MFDAGTGPLAAPDDSPRGERPASATHNTNGLARTTFPGSASEATGGTS